jgi:hypothetical protein
MEPLPRPPPRLPRRSSVTFRPQFTLLLVYFFAFFLFFCLVLALPSLLEGLRTLPAGSGPLTEEEQALASRIARDAVRGKLGYALAASLAALVLGAWTRTLPGLKSR